MAAPETKVDDTFRGLGSSPKAAAVVQYVDFSEAAKGGVLKGAANTAIIGNKDHLLKALEYTPLLTALGFDKEPVTNLVNALKPTRDHPRSKSTMIGTQTLIAGAFPTACSRHNSPAQPHAVTDICVGNMSSSETGVVIVVLENLDHFRGAVSGAARAFYKYNSKTGLPEGSNIKIAVLSLDAESTTKREPVDHIQHLVENVRLTAALVDMPCSELHTDAFKDIATKVAEELGDNVSIEVIRGEELRERGFGGIYGVGKAAEHPPALVHLSLNGKEGGVVLVGKGIVYDTGGLSIKGKTFMPGMKRDMGGAAGVLGAFRCLAQRKVTFTVHAILCLAENAVGERATRPDDIHTLYSGKTVEINNTDAEGRLVLGDGVAFAAKHLRPDCIIDMATLTGAQGISTGRRLGAVYASTEMMEVLAVRTGRLTGDLCHPLPYAPEFHRPEFASTVADMKNSVANRDNAQSSCAGQFIGNHISDYVDAGGKWLHIDMAKPSYRGERGTGYGVALLTYLANAVGGSK